MSHRSLSNVLLKVLRSLGKARYTLDPLPVVISESTLLKSYPCRPTAIATATSTEFRKIAALLEN